MPQPLVEPEVSALNGEHTARLARLIRAQFGFVWRLLRRIGVADSEADLAAQQVFAAATQRIVDLRAGSERAFLLSSCLHVAAQVQRSPKEQAALSDAAPTLEDLDEAQQSREILGVLLQQMPLQLRVVFILHEIEQFSATDIAEIIGIPLSTVVSRLSEALDDFATHLETGSTMANSLLTAAREENPAQATVERALVALGAAGGASRDIPETEEAGVSGPVSARPAPATAGRPAVVIAAKWFGAGLVIGLLITSAVYALGDALAPARAAAR